MSLHLIKPKVAYKHTEINIFVHSYIFYIYSEQCSYNLEGICSGVPNKCNKLSIKM